MSFRITKRLSSVGSLSPLFLFHNIREKEMSYKPQMGDALQSPYSPSLKPLFRFPGGKSADICHFQDFFPKDYTCYVEPFIGGGAVFFHLNHPGPNVIADTNPDVINFYRQVQEGRGPEIHTLVSSFANTRENYLRVRDHLPWGSPLLSAFRFFFLRQTCFRGVEQYDRFGRFNTAWNSTSNPHVPSHLLLDPADIHLLGRTQIKFASFEDTLLENDAPEVFCFLDPPYLECQGKYHSTFGRKEHETLASIFNEVQSRCMLVVSDCELMREIYRGSIIGAYEKRYAMKKERHGRRAKHLIICNYENR